MRKPSLDSLRGVAILLVIMLHAFGDAVWESGLNPTAANILHGIVECGRFGVPVFFVLSGFLITGILVRKRGRPDYYKDFYWRRVLRILPIYWVVIGILLVLKVISIPFALASVLMIANFSMLFHAPLVQYGTFWSLAVEEHFYILWPTCLRHLKDRQLIRIIVALLIAEPLLRLVVALVNSHIDIHYKTPFVLDYIGYGALLALLLHTNVLHPDRLRYWGNTVVLLSGAFCLPEFWMEVYHHMNPIVQALGELPWTWLSCGALLLGLDRDRLGKMPGSVLPFFGYISYGLYLINVLIFEKLQPIIDPHIDRHNPLEYLSARGVMILVAVGIAFLSRRYFEEPFLELKRRRTEPVISE